MQHTNHIAFKVLLLVLILCLSFANVGIAKADEGTPTEPPVANPTDVPTELPPATDVATETPAAESASLDDLLAAAPDDTNLVVVKVVIGIARIVVSILVEDPHRQFFQKIGVDFDVGEDIVVVPVG